MSTAPTAATRPGPLDALRRRWWLAAVLPVLLGALGYFAGLSKAPTYTAEARVAVGAGSLTSGAIAGFPEAAGTLAANYARYVNSTGVTTSDFSTEGVTLSASPIPESYVIVLEAQGADQATVVKAAQKAADQLVKVVNSGKGQSDADGTLAQYKKLSSQWAAAQAKVDAAQSAVGRLNGKAGEAAARATLAKAQAEAADFKVQMDAVGQKYSQQISQSSTDADLTVVRKAEVTKSTKSGTAQQYLLAGVVAGGLLALAIAWLLAQRDGRTTTRRDSAPVTAEAPEAPTRRS